MSMMDMRKVRCVLPTLTPGRRNVSKVNERTPETVIAADMAPRTWNPNARWGTAFTVYEYCQEACRVNEEMALR